MHVKHYTTTLLLNTSKPRMFIAYWMPCTSARPAGPRNPNRSPLSVRDSASLFLSVVVLCLKPIDPSFAVLDGNDLGAVSSRPRSRTSMPSIGAAGRVVNYFAVPDRHRSRAKTFMRSRFSFRDDFK